MLQRNWNTHIGGPLLEEPLPASTLQAFTKLYVFPLQRTSADSFAVNPAPMFKPRWYQQDLAVKTSAGLLRHFLTDTVQLLEGEVYDGHGGPLLNPAYPYRLVGNVTVPAGKTLTIGPGATVRFGAGFRIRAAGTLRVSGSASSVRLVREDDTARGMKISKELVLQHDGELNLP